MLLLRFISILHPLRLPPYLWVFPSFVASSFIGRPAAAAAVASATATRRADEQALCGGDRIVPVRSITDENQRRLQDAGLNRPRRSESRAPGDRCDRNSPESRYTRGAAHTGRQSVIRDRRDVDGPANIDSDAIYCHQTTERIELGRKSDLKPLNSDSVISRGSTNYELFSFRPITFEHYPTCLVKSCTQVSHDGHVFLACKLNC